MVTLSTKTESRLGDSLDKLKTKMQQNEQRIKALEEKEIALETCIKETRDTIRNAFFSVGAKDLKDLQSKKLPPETMEIELINLFNSYLENPELLQTIEKVDKKIDELYQKLGKSRLKSGPNGFRIPISTEKI